MILNLVAGSLDDYPLTYLVKIVARSSLSALWGMWGALVIEALLWLVIIGLVFLVLGLLSARAERHAASSDSAAARELLRSQNFKWASWAGSARPLRLRCG